MSTPSELIRRKRDGAALERHEIDTLVHGIAHGDLSDAQVGALAMALFVHGVDEGERVALTLAMRDSGAVLDWSGLDRPVLDKHSTGGVGDKVSLILAPLVAACGGAVPMISGRGLGHTGGTLDKLDAIPGYDTQPALERLTAVVREAGCAIIGQTHDLAPADRRLYAVRDATGTVESDGLIVASILSKKLAAGLDALVMDVKFGSGAFLPEPGEAEALARALVDVAGGAGLPTVALLTDMDEVLGTTAGNALEVGEAIGVLTGAAREPRLTEVTLALAAAMLAVGGLADDEPAARAAAEEALDERRRRRALRPHGRRPGRPGRPARGPRPPPGSSAGPPRRPAGARGCRAGGRHARGGTGGHGTGRQPRARGRRHRPGRRARRGRADRRRGRARAAAGDRPRRRRRRRAARRHGTARGGRRRRRRAARPPRRRGEDRVTAAATVPKAELHVHLEGTMPPALIRTLAARHGVAVPDGLLDATDRFPWRDFLHFLALYDLAASLVRTAEDYRDITFAYLQTCAREGALYLELTASPENAAAAGLAEAEMYAGIAQGIDDARREHGVEARILVVAIRDRGPERAEAIARSAASDRHPYVVGFSMAGDEAGYPAEQFAGAYAIAHDAGLGCTIHAGEHAGAASVRAALGLPVTRIDHGVRAVEDPELVGELAARGVVLNVCPTSNVALGVFPTYDTHPLRALHDAGVRVTLGSDDPPYFGASLAGEYAVAAERFGFEDAELTGLTRTAIEAAFAEDAVKRSLLDRLSSAGLEPTG